MTVTGAAEGATAETLPRMMVAGEASPPPAITLTAPAVLDEPSLPVVIATSCMLSRPLAPADEAKATRLTLPLAPLALPLVMILENPWFWPSWIEPPEVLLPVIFKVVGLAA